MPYSVSTITLHVFFHHCDISIHDALSESTVQPESANKRIIATAFPSKTSAYVSFSSSEPDAQFTCQLDTGDPAACEFHIRLKVVIGQ